MPLILGIDTSCYTTSAAVVDLKGNLIKENRRNLPVKKGDKGLSQSQALFYHTQLFPQVIEELFNELNGKIVSVCASTQPRNIKDSYMPVFEYSEGMGRSIASILRVPFFTTSHQEGHIKAAVWSAKVDFLNEFIAVHFSGGTSEILHVKKELHMYTCYKVASTEDLNAGQFIDRIGVALGMDFPAGPQLEKLAQKSQDPLLIPSSVKGSFFSFSGPESCAQRMISEGHAPEDIARAVEKCIAKTLEKCLRSAIKKINIKDVLLAGGVLANNYIRKRLREKLTHTSVGAQLHFAEPRLCVDNSVGVALLGKEMYLDYKK